jgi:N-acetylneuraminic acid mutarotase
MRRAIAALLFLAVVQAAVGQTLNQMGISRLNDVTVSWTGPGTLQSTPSLREPWKDVHEASRPFRVQPTNQSQFFRVISRWSTRSNLLAANSEMSVAELDGKIYVMGGYPASRGTVRTVQVYDSAQNRWSLTTPLPIPLNHSMAAAANGRVYIIGGQTDANVAYTNTVFEYNPATSNWTARARMPTSRSAGAPAVIGNLIYVAGGRPPRGSDFAVYDVVNNQWTTLPNLPTQRNHLAAGAIDGKVYVVGGRFEGGFSSPMTAILEVYDPVTRAWTTNAPMPTIRGGINSVVADGRLFVFGGEGATGMFANMEMFVPDLNRWFRLEPLPTAVHGVTGAAYINGWIHLPGGGHADGGSSGSTLHQVFWVGDIGP